MRATEKHIDNQIIVEIRAGRETSLRRIYPLYAAEFKAWARRFCKCSEADLTDAYQEALIAFETGDMATDQRMLQAKFTRIDQSIAMSALYAASHFDVKSIVALTQSGSTALWMSRMNVGVPIFALTPTKATLSKVTLFSGVHPIKFEPSSKDPSAALRGAEDELVRLGLAEEGDLIVMTIGESVGKAGHTNTMKIVRVGDYRKI